MSLYCHLFLSKKKKKKMGKGRGDKKNFVRSLFQQLFFFLTAPFSLLLFCPLFFLCFLSFCFLLFVFCFLFFVFCFLFFVPQILPGCSSVYSSERFIRGMHVFAPPFPDSNLFRIHPNLGPGEVVDGTIRFFPPFYPVLFCPFGLVFMIIYLFVFLCFFSQTFFAALNL